MKHRIHHQFTLTIFFIICFSKCFSLTLSTDGKAKYTIVISAKANENEKHAADVLNKYLFKITGASFLIVDDTHTKSDFEIIVGNTSRNDLKENKINHPDGFSIITKNNLLLLNGGRGRGVVYAVYTFLEKYCGCRKYCNDEAVVPKNTTLVIPDRIDDVEIPAMNFREYYYKATVDEEYREWHKLMRHFPNDSSSQWGMWVHTFNKLVPEEKYFDSHPEYFSFYGGKRQPAQLCLGNNEVFEILVKNLATEMQKKPNAKYWSVSQNDNYGYCQCEKCSAIDSIEGSHSGSIIRFVNKVAAMFPDKIISTLAYQYSRSATKITKPSNNVNIMFCSIECDRSKPIAADKSAGSFAYDFENWSSLTTNILIWDYVVQFSNYVSPFPNFNVLQSNIQFFHANGVRDIFEQGSSGNWSDFGEMKAYLISALLWNPYINVDSLCTDFANGFYGKAGKALMQYQNALEKNLDNANVMLDIYGNPVSPVNSWLSHAHMDEYKQYLNIAKEAASKNALHASRVERVSLPLWYAQLEQAKFYGTGDRGIFEKNEKGKWKVKPEIKKSVNDFVATLKKQNITSLNENVLPPDKYFNDWQRIFSHGMIEHLAMEKVVTFEIPFSPKYPAKGAATLTDGVGGYDDYHYNWLGWEGTDMVAVIDLRELKNVNSISCDFMEDQKSWIFFPRTVSYFYSMDGINYLPFADAINCEAPQPTKTANTKTFASQNDKSKINARYIKVVANNLKTCPRWHIGAGYNCWIFCDEIVVR